MLLAEIKQLKPFEQDQKAKDFVKLAEKAKAATTAYKTNFPEAGKLICALQIRLESDKTSNRVVRNMSFADYWKAITGTKVNNHAESCAGAFGGYVDSGLMTESDYDACLFSALEVAASILTTVKGDLENPNVKAAAEIMKKRDKNYTKSLKSILDSIKPKEPMEAADAEKMLEELGVNLDIVLAVAASQYTKKVAENLAFQTQYIQDSVTGKSVFTSLLKANENFALAVDDKKERRFTDKMLDEWTAEHLKTVKAANAPVPVQTNPPAEPPSADAPENPAESELESALESAHS